MPLTASELGLDPAQLREFVIRPALQHMRAWTQAAENIVLGTAVHESRLRFLHQLRGGPAVGPWQMEPFTHDDIWVNYLARHDETRIAVLGLTSSISRPPATDMHGNLYYAAAMARVFYLRLPDALPAAGDTVGMARLWKARYNTPSGAGTVEQALPAFQFACES